MDQHPEEELEKIKRKEERLERQIEEHKEETG
jgi:hypothetical protein